MGAFCNPQNVLCYSGNIISGKSMLHIILSILWCFHHFHWRFKGHPPVRHGEPIKPGDGSKFRPNCNTQRGNWLNIWNWNQKMWMECVNLVLHWRFGKTISASTLTRPCRICSRNPCHCPACQRDSLVLCYSAICKPQHCWPKTWDRQDHDLVISAVYIQLRKLSLLTHGVGFQKDWHWNSISSKHYGNPKN